MIDPRISKYRQAAEQMRTGEYHPDVPVEGQDEIAALGRALLQLGETLERRFTEFVCLREVTEQINAGLLLDEVLNHVFENFRPIIPYDRIGFSFLADEGELVRARWARSDAPDVKIRSDYAAPLRGSSLERIIETGQPRIINDLEQYLADKPTSKSTRLIVEEGMRSSLTCPLIAMGKPVGFMFFSSMRPNTYRDIHIDIFLQIAGQLATIVEKSRLYQSLLEINELKNKFLGIAAHDLRNPLSIIQGYAKLLVAGQLGKLDPSQIDVMNSILHASDKMLFLLNDLLDHSAIEAGQLSVDRRPTDLFPLLRDIQETHSLMAAEKEIAVELDIDGALPPADVDPHRIEQVIANLITNALKFSFPHSTVTLRAKREGDEIHISVVDQGQGIPEEEQATLFSEFGRTSVRPTAGETSTGLGLAIVHKIVEAHGGRLWVESAVGEGSTFSFTIPVSA